jgi:hypothetical protein
VLRLERLAVVAERDPGLAADEILERDVRRVAAVGEGERVLGAGLDPVEQGVERDTLPARVELRPLRYAVDVDRDLLARQRAELLPRPADRLVDLADDREVPELEGGCAASGRPRAPETRARRTGPAGRGLVGPRRACAPGSLGR